MRRNRKGGGEVRSSGVCDVNRASARGEGKSRGGDVGVRGKRSRRVESSGGELDSRMGWIGREVEVVVVESRGRRAIFRKRGEYILIMSGREREE